VKLLHLGIAFHFGVKNDFFLQNDFLKKSITDTIKIDKIDFLKKKIDFFLKESQTYGPVMLVHLNLILEFELCSLKFDTWKGCK
jgi:hypothetical protein